MKIKDHDASQDQAKEISDEALDEVQGGAGFVSRTTSTRQVRRTQQPQLTKKRVSFDEDQTIP